MNGDGPEEGGPEFVVAKDPQCGLHDLGVGGVLHYYNGVQL